MAESAGDRQLASVVTGQDHGWVIGWQSRPMGGRVDPWVSYWVTVQDHGWVIVWQSRPMGQLWVTGQDGWVIE